MYFDWHLSTPIDPNLRDNGEPILHIAIRKGRFYIVKKLLERGADPNGIGQEGLTALQVARSVKNRDMEALLIPYL